MNISMLISRFPPCIGGTERQAFILSRELVRAGHSVDVLTPRYDLQLPAEEILEGVRVHRLPGSGSSRWAALRFVIEAYRYLLRQATPPDILHAHMIASPAVLACVAGKTLSRKSIVKVACSGPYGDVATSRASWLGRWKLRSVLKGVDRLVCLSNDVEREVQQAGALASQTVRIPNGVDTEFFKPAVDQAEKIELRALLGLTSGRWIVFSGRLTSQKRVDLLINAFHQCHDRYSDLRLVIVGDGPDRQALERLVSEYGLNDHVRLMGNREDTSLYYRAGDFFILPSAAEGISNSLLEAMATGLPCIASRIGGNTDVLQEEENGLLFEPGNANDLIDKLERLAGDPALSQRLGKNAHQSVLKSYSVSQVARAYQTLYQELVSSYDPGGSR